MFYINRIKNKINLFLKSNQLMHRILFMIQMSKAKLTAIGIQIW